MHASVQSKSQNYANYYARSHMQTLVYWSRRASAWAARAMYFGCHYPRVGVSSEGIAVVLCVSECVCVCVSV